MTSSFPTLFAFYCLLFSFSFSSVKGKIVRSSSAGIETDGITSLHKMPYDSSFNPHPLVVQEFHNQKFVSPKKKSNARKRKGKAAFSSQ
ncbi:hypothetical protein ACSVH5_11760 [Flavobacterium sp. RSSA_27]|uniref:hypothetical protein n=1 Tax=Flavobacterium sp. RSSA_27 TaxID=3447667 RepID=UPI003F36402A